MLKYPCLILDHDDTVVQSETTINYPFFCYIFDVFRPGATITKAEYMMGCYKSGFAQMCRDKYAFTEAELIDEYRQWMDYVRTHIPAPYPGIREVIRRQKEAGGLVCVVSHSCRENITRDYAAHFGIQPDEIYGWDYPEHQRKPNPYPIEQILNKYKLSPKDLLIIDDMKPAVEMARSTGVKIGFAAWGRAEMPEICEEMQKMCDYSFETVANLEEFLFS